MSKQEHGASSSGLYRDVIVPSLEDYECEACGGHIHVPISAAWPQQCPHCRMWNPILVMHRG